LTTVLAQAEELSKSAQEDLAEMRVQRKAIKDWEDITKKIEEAKALVALEVDPYVKALKAEREEAKATGLWFRKGEAITKMLAYLQTDEVWKEALKELLAEREAITPQYDKARDYLAINEDRKWAKVVTATKGGANKPSVSVQPVK
jgi:hypothetical protein